MGDIRAMVIPFIPNLMGKGVKDMDYLVTEGPFEEVGKSVFIWVNPSKSNSLQD